MTLSDPAGAAVASAAAYVRALLEVLRAANLMAAHDPVHRRQLERVPAAAGA